MREGTQVLVGCTICLAISLSLVIAAAIFFPTYTGAAFGFFALWIVLRVIFVKWRDRRRGWRVGWMGKERLYYEEFKGGQWLRINLFSEMTGNGWRNPQDVIEFPTQNEWASLPEWAHGRREEIVARIKSELREPRYDYKNG